MWPMLFAMFSTRSISEFAKRARMRHKDIVGIIVDEEDFVNECLDLEVSFLYLRSAIYGGSGLTNPGVRPVEGPFPFIERLLENR